MNLKFDETGAIKKVIGSITFTDYPNKAFIVEVDGRYYAIVYSNGDSIYLRNKGDEYYVWKIHTHDGITLIYEDKKS